MGSRAISTPRWKSGCPSQSRPIYTTYISGSGRPAKAEAGSATNEDAEDQGEQHADQQAGDDRKVNVDIAAVDGDVTGQPSQERDPRTERKGKADDDDENPHDDQQPADVGHDLILAASVERRVHGTSAAP